MSKIDSQLKNKNNSFNDLKTITSDLEKRFPDYFNDQEGQNNVKNSIIIVSAVSQKLTLIKAQNIIATYAISTAETGLGNESGSFKTPLGVHRISEKIGNNAEIATIFKGRKNTHISATILTNLNETSEADNITSRIMWLEGLEAGLNQGLDKNGVNIDSHSRYIYIHGTDEEGRLGQPASHGCIRMGNRDVIELFDQVEVGCLVLIKK